MSSDSPAFHPDEGSAKEMTPMHPTRDPVTGYPAIEIGENLVILQRGTRASDLPDLTVDDIETVLTPSDRGRIADA